MPCWGLLAEEPRTGYGLLKHFEQSLAYAWPASHSQIYPELARLLAAGLIREGERAPARRPAVRADRRRPRRGAPLAARHGAVADGPERGDAAALLPLAARAGGRRGLPARRRPSGRAGCWPSWRRSRSRRIRTRRRRAPTGSRSSSACGRRRRGWSGPNGRSQALCPPARVTTITSSTRTPKLPSTRIDGSSVNVMPASSGVSSSTERNGRSWTSSPIPWPIRWRKPAPSPAASIGARQAAFTSRASAPGRAACTAGLLRREHRRARLLVARRRLAADERAAEVGAVALDDGAEVEEHGLAVARAARAAVASPESSRRAPQVKMCVGKRRAARAADAELVLDLLDEVGHRDARHDARRGRVHRRAGELAGLAHQLQLGRRLHAPQPVHERRALDELDAGQRLLQLEHGLRPGPRPDGEPAGRAEAARRLGEEHARRRRPRARRPRRAAASRPRWKSTTIRGSTKSGSRPGARNAPATQPCA